MGKWRGKQYRGVSTRELAQGKVLVISFMFRGEQCREPLPGLNPQTTQDWEYAFGIKKEIERKIQLRQFFYADYFPKSKKLARFGANTSKSLTVERYLNEYLAHAKKRGLSPSTLEGYTKAIRGLKPLHKILASDLTPNDIKGYIINSTVSLKTMRNRISVLNSALNEAVIEGVLTANPCASVKPHQYMDTDTKVDTRGRNEDVDPFRPKEIEAILAACRYEQERNLIQFAFYTGLRSSELAALKWRDVDVINQEVRVREAVLRDSKNKTTITKGPKTSSGKRTIELNDQAMQALKQQQAYTELKSEYVFEEPRQLKPLTGADQIRKNIWMPVLRLSKVRYRHPYQTRHTFATMMISAGANLWWVADQMGHDGPEMLFRHYGSYIKEHDQRSGRGFNFQSGN